MSSVDAEKRTILIENFSFSFRQVDWIYEGADAVNFDWNYLEFQVSNLKATGLKRTVLGLFEHSKKGFS